MSLAGIATQIPLVFCSDYQSCMPVELEPPFGLPPYTFKDPCCQGFDVTIGAFEDLLRPLIPFLNLLDCVVKMVDIVLTIPKAIDMPPNVEALASVAQKVADFVPCVGKLIAMAPLPVNIVAFARFIRDVMRVLISLLRCMKKATTVYLNVLLDLSALDLSNDDYLKQMGLCLASQGQSLSDQLLEKLRALLNVFNLVNMFLGVILSAVPPLKNFMEENGLYPLGPNIDLGGPPVDMTWADDIIIVLSTVESVANTIAGGA